jgi:F-type H+-transporting ATPase subunit c
LRKVERRPGDNSFSVNKYRAIAAGIGFAIARIWRRSRTVAHRRGGLRRRGAQPGAAGRIQTMMILGLALIESLVQFALLVIFAVVKAVPLAELRLQFRLARARD